jgi:hypothetical protein
VSRYIFKREIQLGDNIISLPRQAELLFVVMKGTDIVLYGVITEVGADEQRLVSVLRVGEAVPDDATCIGAVQVLGLTRLVFDCGSLEVGHE